VGCTVAVKKNPETAATIRILNPSMEIPHNVGGCLLLVLTLLRLNLNMREV
jgi:hypothetical protein